MCLLPYLGIQLLPDLICVNIRLGIYSIGNQQLEGLVYLHRAGELALDDPTILQALYLAYRDLEQPVAANYWQQIGLDYGSQRLAQLPWQWTHLAIDCAWTYIPFGGASPQVQDILLAVPASLQSPTTRCLLAAGAWFELELEFWRSYIQPGMNVIDIGASVGIYTFSAAQIGKNVMVYAIEPFSGSAGCLYETCRINQIENVKIFKNAIDNRDRQAQLVLQASSELNYLLAVDETKGETETEAVVCMTLDRFIQQAEIDRVDLNKACNCNGRVPRPVNCLSCFARSGGNLWGANRCLD